MSPSFYSDRGVCVTRRSPAQRWPLLASRLRTSLGKACAIRDDDNAPLNAPSAGSQRFPHCPLHGSAGVIPHPPETRDTAPPHPHAPDTKRCPPCAFRTYTPKCPSMPLPHTSPCPPSCIPEARSHGWTQTRFTVPPPSLSAGTRLRRPACPPPAPAPHKRHAVPCPQAEVALPGTQAAGAHVAGSAESWRFALQRGLVTAPVAALITLGSGGLPNRCPLEGCETASHCRWDLYFPRDGSPALAPPGVAAFSTLCPWSCRLFGPLPWTCSPGLLCFAFHSIFLCLD